MSMEKALDFIYKLALKIVKWLGFLLTAGLFLSGFLWTCYAEDMTTQLVLTKWDNILLSLLGLAVFLGMIWLVLKLTAHSPQRRNRILLGIVLIWYLAAGAALVLFGKTIPAADSMSVYSAAYELAAGNTGVIHPTNSYLSYYPQQIGLTAYYEILIRLWNLLPTALPAYHFIKCVNVIWACILILFQYLCIRLLFWDHRADTIYLLLSMCNLPLIMYTSFVYGEIPSFALFSIGLWAALKLTDGSFHKGEAMYAAVSVFCLACAVALRKNTLILVIAAALVVLLEAVRRRKIRFLCLAVCYMAAACMVLPLITGFYEHRAGSTLRSGVTPLSYFAMGMQESSRAAGWYNGFNFNTYQDTGMNAQAANERSRQAIKERLAYFRENPGYTAIFYANKFRSQWCDGTYASRQATLATFGGRTAFFQELYEGSYSSCYIEFCNLLQNLIYLGSLSFCFLCPQQKQRLSGFDGCSYVEKKEGPRALEGLPVYLCLIGVIGGFLFHMIWEANARYIFPYGLLLMPYSARGISRLLK